MDTGLKQTSQQTRSKLILLHLLCGGLILSSPMLFADDYMDALRDEAGDLEYLDETQPSNTITTNKKKLSPEINKAIQGIKHFENYFRKQDSASAAIYFRLTSQERLRIYHRFKSTRNFEVARKMTIEMFNKKQ